MGGSLDAAGNRTDRDFPMCAGRQSNACEASKVDSIERLPAIKGEVMTYATLMVHVAALVGPTGLC